MYDMMRLKDALSVSHGEDITVGTGGFGDSKIIRFEDVNMHHQYTTTIGNNQIINQQFRYMNDVFDELKREIDELTDTTEISIISDRKDFVNLVEELEQLNLLEKRRVYLTNKLRKIKEKIEIDFEVHNALTEEREEVALEIKNIKLRLNKGFWKKYVGAEFTVRGKKVRLIITEKRHRFSIKVNRGYKFFVNIWAAIKEAK
jgi:hypothetical protein